jgi:hypothetical protein
MRFAGGDLPVCDWKDEVQTLALGRTATLLKNRPPARPISDARHPLSSL